VLSKDDLGDAARRTLANLSKFEARTCCLAIDELAWAILRRSDFRTAVDNCRAVLALRDLEIHPIEPSDMWEMTREMEVFKLRPRDALHLAVMRRLDESSIVSEDEHFEKAGVKRVSIKAFVASLGLSGETA
jgi:predicted nucleic acid-binding protein